MSTYSFMINFSHRWRPVCIYLLSLLFVGSWWLLALQPYYSSCPVLVDDHTQSTPPAKNTIHSPYLAPLSRERLHKALLGDIELMAGLIAEWDAEGELLQQAGMQQALRLPRTRYLRAQLLTHQIRRKHAGLENAAVSFLYHEPRRMPSVPSHHYLPQTYVAASFLLALTPPEEIVALPPALRRLPQLYPKELVAKVQMDIGPYNTEQIWEAKPDVAFVAHYSQPATCAALRQQGIQLCTIDNVNSIEEVEAAILKVGQMVHRAEEAELLTLFMDAALCALDNRFLLHTKDLPPQPKKVLYVNYFSQFTAPSQRTLTGKLLNRLGINQLQPLYNQGNRSWQVPLSQEQFIRCQPESILLSCAQGEWLRSYLLHNPSMASIPAIQQRRVFTLDPAVQDSPTQFAVLAYYDLVQTLLGEP